MDNKFWQLTCNKSADNLQQTCHEQIGASHANAFWYRLLVTSLATSAFLAMQKNVKKWKNNKEDFITHLSSTQIFGKNENTIEPITTINIQIQKKTYTRPEFIGRIAEFVKNVQCWMWLTFFVFKICWTELNC